MDSTRLRNSIAGLAFTMSALAGCSDDTKKYSKVETCGEYGVQLIDKASKPRDWENAPTVTFTAKETQKRVRTIVRACEAMTGMTDDRLSQGITMVAEELMGETGAKECKKDKSCYLLEEIESRSEWATRKGLPSVCTDLSNTVRVKFSENYEGKPRNLDRALSTLDSLCTTVYYQNTQYAKR